MTNLDPRQNAHPGGGGVIVASRMAGLNWRVSTKRISFGQEGPI
ncbi:MAG TPA: hypothetical protein VEO53_08135 [Candidatus Binatia bacterium]|nr:hypothetical protein [Candidatus Binatia bacterium]